MTREQKTPEIYLSMPHACSYLPQHTATTLFVDPRYPLDMDRFGRFMQLGFRRSGDLVYRPHCPECGACVPVRIPVAGFSPNRSQRRIWQRNQDLEIHEHPAVFSSEHFALYQRYQSRRHPGGGMDDADPKKYTQFLVGQHIDTTFFEFREQGRLLAVAVVDHLPDGLSAVYTFFDPDENRRALGVYAVLWEISQASEMDLPYLYLGYWIAESPKMSYKANYAPLEAYRQGKWCQVQD